MSMTEQLTAIRGAVSKDATDLIKDIITPRSLGIELNRLRHFHENINKQAAAEPRTSYEVDAIRRLLSVAAAQVPVGHTFSFSAVMDQVLPKMPELQDAAVSFISDAGIANVPKMQACFLPTGVLGVWRRNSFRVNV